MPAACRSASSPTRTASRWPGAPSRRARRTASWEAGDYPRDASVWAVVCFFANRELRGSGSSARLLDAACEEAARAGADVLEGYPVAPDSPSYRFMGTRPVFRAAGFEEIGRVGKRRHAMRRWLRPGGAHGHSAAG